MIMWTLLSMAYRLFFKPFCFTHVTGTGFKETALFFNVHLTSLVGFILRPTDKSMLKVNNNKIRLICIFLNLKINTARLCSFVFIVDFDYSQNINIVFLLLTLNKYLSVGCAWRVIMFRKPYFKAYFIQKFIIAPNCNKLRPH